MAETDPDRMADELEQEADELKRRSEELEEQTENVSREWERKRSDPNVPGAPPPDDSEDEQSG
jgi:predicted  nucleic acid-binding Zn-ribbon protein